MPKVLIVEDDYALSNAYDVVLQKSGLQTATAADGKQALSAISGEHFDVILLDMLMPEMSGLEFLKQAKLKEKAPKTKVLVISNTESAKVRDESLQLGAVDYVLKVNCTPHDVANKILALVK